MLSCCKSAERLKRMKTTSYFNGTRSRSDRAGIKEEWICLVIEHPEKTVNKEPRRKQRGILKRILSYFTPQEAGNMTHRDLKGSNSTPFYTKQEATVSAFLPVNG